MPAWIALLIVLALIIHWAGWIIAGQEEDSPGSAIIFGMLTQPFAFITAPIFVILGFGKLFEKPVKPQPIIVDRRQEAQERLDRIADLRERTVWNLDRASAAAKKLANEAPLPDNVIPFPRHDSL